MTILFRGLPVMGQISPGLTIFTRVVKQRTYRFFYHRHFFICFGGRRVHPGVGTIRDRVGQRITCGNGTFFINVFFCLGPLLGRGMLRGFPGHHTFFVKGGVLGTIRVSYLVFTPLPPQHATILLLGHRRGNVVHGPQIFGLGLLCTLYNFVIGVWGYFFRRFVSILNNGFVIHHMKQTHMGVTHNVNLQGGPIFGGPFKVCRGMITNRYTQQTVQTIYTIGQIGQRRLPVYRTRFTSFVCGVRNIFIGRTGPMVTKRQTSIGGRSHTSLFGRGFHLSFNGYQLGVCRSVVLSGVHGGYGLRNSLCCVLFWVVWWVTIRCMLYI